MEYRGALTRLRSGWSSRLLLLCMALSYLIVQIEAAHHSLLSFHVVCEEHGSVVEDLPRVVQTAPAQPLSYSKSAPPAQHHACELPPGVESGASLPEEPVGAVVTVAQGADPGLSAPATPIRAGPPLFRLAPKSSPPRA